MFTATITWVSPADALPDNQVLVLVAMPTRRVRIGWYGAWDERWRINDIYCPNPLYWAALPVGPGASDGE